MSTPLTLTLEIRPDGESFTGRAAEPGAATIEFVGWLGLIAALDSLLRAALPVDDAPACVRWPPQREP